MIGLFSGGIIALLDCMACIGLAAAATFRARQLGAQLFGALLLGCLCGLAGTCLREWLLHGNAGLRMILSEMPVFVLAGAFLGLFFANILQGARAMAFFWLDSVSLGLAGCLGACLGMAEAGIGFALVAAVSNGLAPGLIRDVTLGDAALMLDEPWYAAAAAIGGIVTLIILVLGAICLETPDRWHLAEISCITGAASAVSLRLWKGGKAN